MKKKRILSWVLVGLILMSLWPMSFAEGEDTLTIHYKRADGVYDNWSVWLWKEGGEGQALTFSGEDAFGAFLKVKLDDPKASYGFIVRLGEWEAKDFPDDQFIDFAMDKEIWITSGEAGYTTIAPKGSGQEVVGDDETKMRIHYRRLDQKYDGWNMWVWPEGGNGAAYTFTGTDNYGVYVDLVVPETKGVSQIGLIARLREWEAKDVDVDRFVPMSWKNDEGLLEVWLLQDTERVYRQLDHIDFTPKLLKASFDDFKTFSVEGSQPFESALKTNAIKVTSQGKAVMVDAFRINSINPKKMTISLSQPIRFEASYEVVIDGFQERTIDINALMGSDAFAKATTYQGELGALYTQAETHFKVWAPTSSGMTLKLYPTGHDSETSQVIPMQRTKEGVWETVVKGDLHGVYYTYETTFAGVSKETMDPYARAAGVNGLRGMVVDLSRTNPKGWEDDQRPPFKDIADAIVYELHIRDLSMHEDSGILNKGKFLGLTETGTKNSEGLPTGLDHIKALGVTHLQILPMYDYLSVDETNLGANQFNWGYDPQNYNLPEGSYATDPYKGEVRIMEAKKMIQTLHENGIRVVMDVVYNHTGKSADSHLNILAPGYYYRFDDSKFCNGSGCGNETASERAMVRKMMIDSVLYWVEEYHIDGFRFDLMGVHDIETMQAIEEAVHAVDPSILIYGEGWTGGQAGLSESQRLVKANMKKVTGIGAFNDDMRDGIKGHVFNPTESGFVQGGKGFEESVKFGVVGAISHPGIRQVSVMYAKVAWANQPTQSINYVSAHDNHTLFDKLALTAPEASLEDRLKMQALANGIVLTSQGIPFLHAGVEFARTKQGDENSYKSPDAINALDWSSLSSYQELTTFYQDLIALRKAHPSFRLGSADRVVSQITFYGTQGLTQTPDGVVAYLIRDPEGRDQAGTIFVAYNANKTPITLQLPSGEWNEWVRGYQVVDGLDQGLSMQSVVIEPISMAVLGAKQVLPLKVSEDPQPLPEDDGTNQESDPQNPYLGLVVVLGLGLGLGAWVRHRKSKLKA